ncbi:GATA-type zinc finger protein 1 [Caerostris darwini]|uniref:GATA-type zinc finger protein 1 n=1 Tax=Caerostris darwini TaxID=1538125 RepID=A0AAV4NJQ4_9ARAC|nr:GATA-type zinc finger protein 1 [Caerostris darwini]
MNGIESLLKYASMSSSYMDHKSFDDLDFSMNEAGDELMSRKASFSDPGIEFGETSSSPNRDCDKPKIGSRKRKSFTPCRSLPLDDPNFRGVTITMENKLINSEWKLVMHTKFSLSPKKKRQFKAYVESSDDEEIPNSNYPPVNEEKHCASCSVKKTPLWRDAEDGTPLCNACGIRYKKYKLRCGTCWHIPKKDEFHPTCQYCGSFYEYVYPRR